jgi:hypothetical protein
MSIEQNYSIRFIGSLALREKQIQQNYRPIIAVHKWFARRPGTLSRGLLSVPYISGPSCIARLGLFGDNFLSVGEREGSEF